MDTLLSTSVLVQHSDVVADVAKGKGTRTVGVPIHEARLTEAFAQDAHNLMPPGAGRSLHLLLEPRIGRGRPDVLLLAISSSGLISYLRKANRLATFTEAQVISGDVDEPVGVSATYARDLRSKMQAANWKDSQLAHARNLVHDSLAVEAKMSDWRRAVRQVARFGPMAHRTAILMPENVAARVDLPTLGVYESGLIKMSGDRLSWLRTAPKRPLGDAQKLWLLELLHRQLQRDQIPSATRISSTA
ncbi:MULTISPECIES: hypothetical protein [unclassified Rhodococcus (in: high G+C Gram-positive bacteria)]|uniref:hypothetical protein n=1 Tax=unclassified Rhodococcus (in: high G+C Gram-positive bacteria) TaxID=192944 RepID=UPI00117BD8CE|nr:MULTISPECIES: hypothetical protein [unclassified Rhodococcus (in: high G+C Gram-positive bacteria)]